MKKRICVFCLFVFAFLQLLSAGVLASPKKINLLKTQHFDILYPDESSVLAAYIVDHAENFYSEAQYHLETEVNIKIPVVISPDSDSLSVSYSSYPYNRLLVFDAVPTSDQLGMEDVFGSMLYREIYIAVAQSKMSPFNQFIHDTIGGDKYTPATLFNLPSSFVEGYGYLIQSQYDYLKINDGYFLQILSEAKLEGNFPTWFQIFAKRDTYPGVVLSRAAGTAFSAFLIQSRGIEKYAELWDECGKIHPFFAAGIIKKVYKTSITDLWQEFVESIPLPANLEAINALDEDIEKLFEYSESNYNHLVNSKYGIIWFDDLRHEVELYDFNQEPLFLNLEKLQTTLFSADGIQRLSVSKDGRYLSVSFVQSKEYLKKNVTWIYDLEQKMFLDDVYYLRDATVITLADGKNAIAGINVENKVPELQIYTSRNFGSKNNELIYSQSFTKNNIPLSPVYAGPGKIMYLLNNGESSVVSLLNIEEKTNSTFAIQDLQNNQLKIKNLVYQNDIQQENDIYTFQFSNLEENSLQRTGTFILEDEVPVAVSMQDTDVAGGIYYPILMDENIVFASRKLFHDELEILPFQKLQFQPGQSVAVERTNGYIEENETDSAMAILEDYEISKYSLLRYWHRFSFAPFIPIKNISFEDGADSALGLGAQIKLVPDPFMNNKFTISGAWNFLNLDFVWMLNAPEIEKKQIEKTKQTVEKDKTFAFFYENTSTPVDIKIGALYRFNLLGEYDYEALGGVSWNIPLGFTFNELNFDIYGTYKVSTDYYDVNFSNIYGSKNNFPTFVDAYELGTGSVSLTFKNIHQYGSSIYEQKGFSAGIEVYSLWDIYKYRHEEKTDPYVSQIFFGAHGEVALPKILPLKPNKHGWILALPVIAKVDVANKAGDILNSDVQMLLIGKEVQNGFPFINLYFNRIGLKAGHELNIVYDTTNLSLLDVRRFEGIYDILVNSKIGNGIYLLLDMDFLFPIGPLSQQVIHSEFRTTFYPDTGGFTFNLDFKLNF